MGYTLTLSESDVTGVVRQLLGEHATIPTFWNVAPLDVDAMSPSSIGLYRVSGQHPEPWSAILKVFAQPANPTAEQAQHPFYWRREMMLYQGDVLHHLPYGVAAPRFLGVTHQPGSISWLWLEDLDATHVQPVAGLDALMLAARCLGRIGGMWLDNAALMEVPYLSRGVGRTLVADNAALVERSCQSGVWSHPLLRDAFTEHPAERIATLWSNRARFLDALASQPQTLAHHDCWRKNLFVRTDQDGSNELVLIDWELSGLGALGEDIGNLLGASLLNFDLDASEAEDAADAMLIAYLNGLAEAGWRDDPTPIRFAFNATAAIRCVFSTACWPVAIAHDRTGNYIPDTEYRWQRPIEAIFDHWARVTGFLLDRADRARRFID